MPHPGTFEYKPLWSGTVSMRFLEIIGQYPTFFTTNDCASANQNRFLEKPNRRNNWSIADIPHNKQLRQPIKIA